MTTSAAGKGRRGATSKTPAGLKLLEGRGNGRDSGGRPVKPPPGFVRLPPEPPALLLETKPNGDLRTPDAVALWRSTVPELQRLTLTKPIDAPALAAYCLTWQRFCTAQRTVNTRGLTAKTSQGVGVAPWVRVLETASKELRSWAVEFGLTPSAEQRLGEAGSSGGTSADDEDEEANPFAG